MATWSTVSRALDWVVERQCVKTDKDSGTVNDANDWANESMEIVRALPRMRNERRRLWLRLCRPQDIEIICN
ncbi:MAG: type ISP restriction/modification enzyme [Methylococcaceae bacterium]|jgi:hypothetical protein